MDRALTVADFKPFLQAMFPDVEAGRDDNYPYEHPMTAVGLVLMSAATIGTADAKKLILFTGYSLPFISAIMVNMENSHLWVDGRYDALTWLSADGSIDADCLWTHVEVACGLQRMPAADPDISADACGIADRGGYKGSTLPAGPSQQSGSLLILR